MSYKDRIKKALREPTQEKQLSELENLKNENPSLFRSIIKQASFEVVKEGL